MKCIKIVHTADFHLGVDTIGPIDPTTKINGRVLDYLDAFDAMIEYADAHSADLALIAGDAFHKRDPDPTYIRLFAERLVRLARICQVVMIPGNHDMPGIVERSGAVDLFDALQLPNIYVARVPQVITLTTNSGDIQIACMPYPMRQRYVTSGECRSEDAKSVLQAKVAYTIDQLVKAIDTRIPAIFMGHFSVSGASYGSERSMVVGLDAEVLLETILQPCFSYAALGHLHLYQNVGTADLPVIYPGSLERVDFTEEHHKKGFVWIEVGDDTTYKFVKVDARPYVTIDIDVTGKRRPTELVLDAVESTNIESAVVRIIIRADDGIILRTEDVAKAALASGAYCIHSINIKRNIDVSDTRLSDVPVASMSHVDLIDAYLHSLDKFSNKEIGSLLSLAVDVMEDAYAEI
jgi:DNA repair protein SbcD/Mre11